MRTLRDARSGKRLLPGFIFLLLSMIAILFAASARAQSADDAKIPSGPLLASAPDFSQWVVTFSYPNDSPKNSNPPIASPPSGPDTRTRTVTTTKTREIIHEEFIDGVGTKFDEWHVGPTLYIKGSGSTLWGEIDSGNGDLRTAHVEQLSASGFRDLDWITKDNYVGTIKYGGRYCLLFTSGAARNSGLSDPDSLASQIETMDTFALIDAESRLPVRVRAGGMTRLYQFKDPPSEKLALPPDLAEQLRKGEEGRERLNQRMPRPY